jgi:hypothetical protein
MESKIPLQDIDDIKQLVKNMHVFSEKTGWHESSVIELLTVVRLGRIADELARMNNTKFHIQVDRKQYSCGENR